VRHVWGLPPIRWMPTPRGKGPSPAAGGVTTLRTTKAVLSGKKRRRLLQSRRPSTAERATSQARLPPRKLRPGLLPNRWTCVRVGAMLSKGVCHQGHHLSPQHPSPAPQPVTEAPVQSIVTATRETARPKKPEPKATAAPKRATGKASKKAAACQNRGRQTLSTQTGGFPPNVPPPQSRKSLISSITYPSKHVWS
jgi:hypothetical protein